ncbi:MAG: sulfotransferase domain-containing protein [Methylocella sp.]
MHSSRVKIIFHIGLEKTGTTSFQRFCTRNARRLMEHKVLYPKRSSAFYLLNHVPLTASYLPSERPDDFHLRSPIKNSEMVKSLKREIEASSVEKVIISSEHLSSRFRAPQIEKLAEDFNEYECHVVIALRDHLSRLFSSYSTRVMSGSDQTLDEFAAMVLEPDNLYMRYADIIRMWEASFGRDNVIVFDYNESSDVIHSILSKIGLIQLRTIQTDDHKCNASLDANVTEAVRLINIANQSVSAYRSKIPYLEFIKLQYVRSVLRKKLQAQNLSQKLAHTLSPLPEEARSAVSKGEGASQEPHGASFETPTSWAPQNEGEAFETGSQSHGSHWRLGQPYREQLLAIAEADALWLAKNYSMPVSLIKPRSLPDAAPEEFQDDAAKLLAKTLTHTISDRWSLYRFNMASRAALFFILDKLRSIRGR